MNTLLRTFYECIKGNPMELTTDKKETTVWLCESKEKFGENEKKLNAMFTLKTPMRITQNDAQ